MSLHIRKLCVGAESISDLECWQAGRLRRDGSAGLWHGTRNWPRRRDEVLDGGSLYWIIRGAMSVRQRIVGFEPYVPAEIADDPEAKPYCRLMLDPVLVRTEPWPHRPFQGWRYLVQEEAPPDLPPSADADALPAELVGALRQMGAW